MIYFFTLEPDSNGTLLVTSKEFPELTTFGKDRASAWKNGRAALEEAIAARIEDGAEIPQPASLATVKRRKAGHTPIWVKLPLLTALKVELYNALRDSDVATRAELARRLNWHREQVDRLFRLDHKSQVGQIEEAFKALDRDIDIDVKAMA